LVLGIARAADPPAPRPITGQFMDTLEFGRVVASHDGGGVVTLHATSPARDFHGAADGAGGYYGRARLKLRGEPGASFVIILPQEVPFAGVGGGVTLRDLRSIPADSWVFGADGTAEVLIGASLAFGPGTAGGHYRAGFDVMVEYP
jgi:hypothetical protein